MKELAEKNVLVTGGAGFIGSELVRQLLEQHAKVTVVDDLSSGRRENLEGLTGKLEFILQDIRDAEAMKGFVQRADIIFHLACLGVRHSIHSPIENHKVNAEATLQLLVLAHAAKVKRFVYVSSSEVYGPALRVPMEESHPTHPHTVYGASKLAGECYARAFHDTYGFPTVVLRPFNSYGPRSHHEGDSGEVIPKFLLRTLAGKPMIIFGDGKQTRDFTYVSDTARGIMAAGIAEKAVGQTINFGSGFEISINHLADEVKAVLGKPQAEVVHDEPRPGDVQRLYSDSEKAEKIFGFKPKISLKEGLKLLKTWYESQGKSPESLLEAEVVRNWEKQPQR